jgi:hypothetical protein
VEYHVGEEINQFIKKVDQPQDQGRKNKGWDECTIDASKNDNDYDYDNDNGGNTAMIAFAR